MTTTPRKPAQSGNAPAAKPAKPGKPADNPRSRIGDRMRSPEHIEAALRASGGVISIAATKLGCHRQRLYEWIGESPALSQLLTEIRNEVLDLAEAKLLEHIKNGSEKSIHFYLKTQGRDRGYSEKVLLGGAPGEPVEVSANNLPNLAATSQEDRDAIRAILERTIKKDTT